jgi:hypothetical protein
MDKLFKVRTVRIIEQQWVHWVSAENEEIASEKALADDTIDDEKIQEFEKSRRQTGWSVKDFPK